MKNKNIFIKTLGQGPKIGVGRVIGNTTYFFWPCEFDSWQCRMYIISHVHTAYDYFSPFGVL